ncbi:MAG: glycoside hydrolase family 15 protein [Marmoricola sp.]
MHDFMPVLKAHDEDHRQRLVRRVVAVRGSAQISMRMAARPDYGLAKPKLDRIDGGVLVVDGDVSLALSTTVDLEIDGDDVTADLELSAGGSALFVLEVLRPGEERRAFESGDIDELFDATAAFWRIWLGQSTYTGRWRERVHRSALTLKLLCHEPSGGIVASPTTSLPEHLGGARNWDYRYVWIRDAAFSIYALLRLGFTDEAAAFVRWLSERLARTDDSDDELGPLRVL